MGGGILLLVQTPDVASGSSGRQQRWQRRHTRELDVGARPTGLPKVRWCHTGSGTGRQLLRRAGRGGQRSGAGELRERCRDTCSSAYAHGEVVRHEGRSAIPRRHGQGGRDGGDGVGDAGQVHDADLARRLQEVRALDAGLRRVRNVGRQRSDLCCGLLDVEDTLGRGRLLTFRERDLPLQSSAIGLDVRLQIHSLSMPPAQRAGGSLLHEPLRLLRILRVHGLRDRVLHVLELLIALRGLRLAGVEEPLLDDIVVLVCEHARHFGGVDLCE
mmetsp:Transcript_155949/g.498364  ORF Transcript_155949/g.498364 Transcript_155949/m.498364 type:complete len:272 (-) Transcript_155949:84-899(-)